MNPTDTDARAYTLTFNVATTAHWAAQVAADAAALATAATRNVSVDVVEAGTNLHTVSLTFTVATQADADNMQATVVSAASGLAVVDAVRLTAQPFTHTHA